MMERPHRQGYREALKRTLGMRQRYLELAAIVAMAVTLPATLARSQGQILDRLAVASQSTPERLVLARKLVSEVERSPSAYLPESRAKLEQARSVTRAALEENPRDAEAIKLLARIDSLLAQLAPRRRPEHPTEAEADAALDRLEGLVKGGGARREVEAAHTHLRKLRLGAKAWSKGSDSHISTFLVSVSISRRIRSSSSMRPLNLPINVPIVAASLAKYLATSPSA